jgi:hypothetical protein
VVTTALVRKNVPGLLTRSTNEDGVSGEHHLCAV